ncbi:MAG: carbamoyltransferase HypF, partial [Candidatus Omnitrophota bacterium]
LEPWRALAAWLDFDKAIDKKQALKKIWQAGINSPLASSMGRLFDAVGCLVLGKNKAGFEAELAIALEKLAGKSKLRGPGYEFPFSRLRCEEEIDAAPVFRQIQGDLQAKIPRPEIARRFHQGVAEMIVRRASGFRRKYGVGKIVLSGGVFQNKLLLKITLDLLYKKDFRVFTQGKLPCNDAGISLGQAMIAGLRG